jgi:5-methylcytosine-specific restriction protein A
MFDPQLLTGDEIDNARLQDIFKCSKYGGMRRSLSTNTLVLINGPYGGNAFRGRWVDDILYFVGEIDTKYSAAVHGHNKTLAESPRNGVEVFLFLRTGPSRYKYEGRVALDRNKAPRKTEIMSFRHMTRGPETRPDNLRHNRRREALGSATTTWEFPLRLVRAQKKEPFGPEWERIHMKARTLPDEELLKRAREAKRLAVRTTVSTIQYYRDPYVSEWIKRSADGRCQLCGTLAPFSDNNGNPYLETHHIKWLSEGGEDSIRNTVALCPNCHRKMHIVNAGADQKRLRSKVHTR